MAEMVKAKLNDMFEMVLPAHRAARPHWYTPTGWEKKRLERMHQIITERSATGFGNDLDFKEVVYYIGAEEGEMAALCQMWGADVVLFEPNDRVWPNMKAIWEANNLQNPLLCFSGFAANKDSWSEIFYNRFPSSADGEVIGDHGFKELKDPGDIEQIKIDTMVAVSGITPTIVSLDVEGSEWEVLRGAEETLKKYHPSIFLSLHPEVIKELYNEEGARLREWLINLGYKEELIDYPLHEVHLYYYA
jgi:FkbM family methyltransferase